MSFKKHSAAPEHRPHHPKQRERGDVLLDALVAMLLASIIGLGPAYVAARASVIQTQGGLQNLAAVQLRSLLSQQGPALCATTPHITVGGNSLDVSVDCTNRSEDIVQVGGKSITMDEALQNRITLSVTSQDLFGGTGTIEVTQ